MHPLQPHCKNRAISLKSEPGWKLGSIFSDLSQYGSGVTSDPGNSASDLKFDLEMNLAPQIWDLSRSATTFRSELTTLGSMLIWAQIWAYPQILKWYRSELIWKSKLWPQKWAQQTFVTVRSFPCRPVKIPTSTPVPLRFRFQHSSFTCQARPVL